MSIYITGDTHIPIDISKLSTRRWEEQKELTQNDFLIICGDFGGVWNNSKEDKYWQKWLNEKPFKTLFVDGNHENFRLLNNYKIEEFHGGRIHKIMPNVIHLMRGQVFDLNGIKVFTMGGAESVDRIYRKEDVSWWKDEMPRDEEYDEALKNLDRCGWKVNLIISHCAPTNIQSLISAEKSSNKLTDFFESIKQKLTYDKWYFGHYHLDECITSKDIVVYNKIIKYI